MKNPGPHDAFEGNGGNLQRYFLKFIFILLTIVGSTEYNGRYEQSCCYDAHLAKNVFS